MTAGQEATLAPDRTLGGGPLLSRTRPLAAGEVDDLLDLLGSDGFAWLAGGTGFVTAGVAARVALPVGPDRFERAAQAVAERLASIIVEGRSPDGGGTSRPAPDPTGPAGPGPQPGPLAVGALPFDERTPGELVIPALVVARRADGTGWLSVTGAGQDVSLDPGPFAGRRGRPGPAAGPEVDLTEDPGRAEWTESVRRILAAIDAGQVRKVVLARQVLVEAGRPFDRRAVLDRLRRSHPSCYTYAAGGFVGASPELLVRRRGAEVWSCPMAGTVGRGSTREEDEILAAALSSSPKEAEEHRLLVEAVVAALTPVCAGPAVAGAPEVVRFPTVSHLATRVSGVLAEPAPSALALAGRLHPTPAVGGLPRAGALAAIAALEGFDRGLYAGPVGWVDAAGDGEWAVALRGAQLDGRRARLVAGAGIVAGSDPDAEWAETEAKLGPMLTALRGGEVVPTSAVVRGGATA